MCGDVPRNAHAVFIRIEGGSTSSSSTKVPRSKKKSAYLVVVKENRSHVSWNRSSFFIKEQEHNIKCLPNLCALVN